MYIPATAVNIKRNICPGGRNFSPDGTNGPNWKYGENPPIFVSVFRNISRGQTREFISFPSAQLRVAAVLHFAGVRFILALIAPKGFLIKRITRARPRGQKHDARFGKMLRVLGKLPLQSGLKGSLRGDSKGPVAPCKRRRI